VVLIKNNDNHVAFREG